MRILKWLSRFLSSSILDEKILRVDQEEQQLRQDVRDRLTRVRIELENLDRRRHPRRISH